MGMGRASITLAVMSAVAWLLLSTRVVAGASVDNGETWPMTEHDPPKLELVMQLVVTCSDPESPGGAGASKDGQRTDDGVTIIIHNKGLSYGGNGRDGWHYRLAPEFIAPKGKYDWLNRALFISTLVDVPASMRLARGPHENDRLIQIYRVN